MRGYRSTPWCTSPVTPRSGEPRPCPRSARDVCSRQTSGVTALRRRPLRTVPAGGPSARHLRLGLVDRGPPRSALRGALLREQGRVCPLSSRRSLSSTPTAACDTSRFIPAACGPPFERTPTGTTRRPIPLPETETTPPRCPRRSSAFSPSERGCTWSASRERAIDLADRVSPSLYDALILRRRVRERLGKGTKPK